MYSPELTNQIAVWRQKATAGTLSIEEMKQAIAALRAGNRSAASSPKRGSTSTKGPARSAGDLLDELSKL